MLVYNALVSSTSCSVFFKKKIYLQEEKFKHEKDTLVFDFVQKKKPLTFFKNKNHEFFFFFFL